MGRKRLWLDEIDAVAGVDEPDNPPARLLFWKRRKETPSGEAMEKGVPVVDEPVIEETVVEALTGEPAEADIEKRFVEEIEKAQQERDAALAQLAEEVEKRLDGEWVEKARPFETLLGPASEIGPCLRKVAGVLPEEAQRLEAAFKAAMERIDLAKMVEEVGSDNSADDDPIAQRDLFVKQHPDLPAAEAKALYWEKHPEAKSRLREGA